LKIPYCEGFDKVAMATSFPILMLGGEASGDPTGTLQEFWKGMAAGQNVRGALVGRNILYPGRDDPSAVADAVSGIVHRNLTVEQSLNHIDSVRGRNTDKLTSVLA
jgi:DhnA family fructose-bisphosphate aldolase class Ia